MTLKPDQMERLLLLMSYTNEAQLQAAAEAMRDRSRAIQRSRAARVSASLEPGVTRIETRNLKPKYLNGMFGTYLGDGVKPGTAKVLLDHQPVGGRGMRYSQTISVPLSCLEVISTPSAP